ncbi:hypothetical protein OF83DRAFT_1090998 [Amylostereum chailletii]|nr:hypothetical protein OF83DRAFT_1090998 [Amylostereum chailletii]
MLLYRAEIAEPAFSPSRQPPPPLLRFSVSLSTPLSHTMHSDLFILGDTRLLFVPTDEFRKCFFTSVYIYSISPSKPSDQRFLTAQKAIYDLVLKLTTLHARQPFPHTAFPFIVEGEGYRLYFVLKPWPYGKTIELAWGGMTLIPTEDKWQIGFELLD